jgi:hypothetical protein
MVQKTVYLIYDPRYLTDQSSATLFESCETLKEAKRNRREYGEGNVIVKTVLHMINGQKHEEK